MHAARNIQEIIFLFLYLKKSMKKRTANICFQNHHQRFKYWIEEKRKRNNPKYEPIVYVFLFFQRRNRDIQISKKTLRYPQLKNKSFPTKVVVE